MEGRYVSLLQVWNPARYPMELVELCGLTRIKLYFTGTSAVKVSRKSFQAVSRTIRSSIWILSQSDGLLVVKVSTGVASRAWGRGAPGQASSDGAAGRSAKDC